MRLFPVACRNHDLTEWSLCDFAERRREDVERGSMIRTLGTIIKDTALSSVDYSDP